MAQYNEFDSAHTGTLIDTYIVGITTHNRKSSDTTNYHVAELFRYQTIGDNMETHLHNCSLTMIKKYPKLSQATRSADSKLLGTTRTIYVSNLAPKTCIDEKMRVVDFIVGLTLLLSVPLLTVSCCVPCIYSVASGAEEAPRCDCEVLIPSCCIELCKGISNRVHPAEKPVDWGAALADAEAALARARELLATIPSESNAEVELGASSNIEAGAEHQVV